MCCYPKVVIPNPLWNHFLLNCKDTPTGILISWKINYRFNPNLHYRTFGTVWIIIEYVLKNKTKQTSLHFSVFVELNNYFVRVPKASMTLAFYWTKQNLTKLTLVALSDIKSKSYLWKKSIYIYIWLHKKLWYLLTKTAKQFPCKLYRRLFHNLIHEQ